MDEAAPSRAASLAWPLALVAGIHLLTTPGQWLSTDQKEYILVADRLVGRGSLHLAEAGEAPRTDLPWVAPAAPGQPQRSRLLPLTSIALAPLVLADRGIAGSRPPADRPLVQLQGHAFVLAGLALVGLAVAGEGVPAAGAAAAIVLTGLSWPVWQVSRRGGPEAIFVLLVALFVLGAARASAPRTAASGVAMMAVSAALLPWGNPTGPVLAASLLAGYGAFRWVSGGDLRVLAWPAAALTASSAAVVVLWNHHYHGHWWLGGYATHLSAAGSVVDPAVLAGGVREHVASAAVQGGVLLAIALAGAYSVAPARRWALAVPAALLASMLALFSAFPQPEPTRRLAAVWPAWGAAAGAAFPGLFRSLSAREAGVALAAVIGFHGFWSTEGRYHEGPGGLFYPSVLWVRMWIDGVPAWQYALPCAALLALVAVAASRTTRLLAEDLRRSA
jgi:hypothetical protein